MQIQCTAPLETNWKPFDMTELKQAYFLDERLSVLLYQIPEEFDVNRYHFLMTFLFLIPSELHNQKSSPFWNRDSLRTKLRVFVPFRADHKLIFSLGRLLGQPVYTNQKSSDELMCIEQLKLEQLVAISHIHKQKLCTIYKQTFSNNFFNK